MASYNSHAGHNKIVPGASKYLNEVTEARKVNALFIKYMKAAGNTMYDCTDEVGRTQNQNLANIVKKCNSHTVKIDFAWHLNAGGGKGVEVIIFDNRMRAVANDVAEAISKALGIPNRGVKVNPNLYVLANTKAQAMLIECCFVDSKSDAEKWDAEKCAKAAAEAVTGKQIILKPASKPKFWYQAFFNGKWGKNVSSGAVGKSTFCIRAFRINATNKDGSPYVKTRVKYLKGGYSDYKLDRGLEPDGKDFSGDKNQMIEFIQMELKNCPGWEIKYRVELKNGKVLPWVRGANNYNSDGYAGLKGYAIRRIRVRAVRV